MATESFGTGRAVLDEETGAILQFRDPNHPQRHYLLEPALFQRHSAIEHNWGSGYIISNRGSGRWNAHAPASTSRDDGKWSSSFTPLEGINLDVKRIFGQHMQETFTFTNTSKEPITITSLAIQTPFADIYNGAKRALVEAVHTHVFCGGKWAWVLAQPMSGDGTLLGLSVEEGGLWGYSIETRNTSGSSNNRGHIVLHVTDFARSPDAFGGQPKLELQCGQSYTLRWKLSWYGSVPQFLDAVSTHATFSAYSASADGGCITLQTSNNETPTSSSSKIKLDKMGITYKITASEPGLYPVEVAGGRTEIYFHPSLRQTVQSRADYILRHQRTRDRPGLLAHALVPVDCNTLLTQTTNGWPDWTDGSERIAMPCLLQLGAMRGWLQGDVIEEATAGWAKFAESFLMDSACTSTRGSQTGIKLPRLYDVPWLCQFFHDRYRWKNNTADLDFAARILERGFEQGATDFLAIHLSETTRGVIKDLEMAGQAERATSQIKSLVDSARAFAARGTDLPGHELSYEQSMVAPLINLFIDAYALTKEDVFLEKIKETLPWLLAFGGPQPHARLHGVAIRHWDGYWFGQNRQWGDVFPHYWSTLTSMVLLRLPASLRTPSTDFIATQVMRANMLNFNTDGSATCAFVTPTSVDGRPAHVADPLANDQDWHLVMWMRMIDDGLIGEN